MSQQPSHPQDFDEWSELAVSDPQGFEAMRLAAIEDVIRNAPEAQRDRLRCLQWRIDQERRLASNPMGACIRLSRMMWEGLLGPQGLRERFVELAERLQSPLQEALQQVAEPPRSAVVVPLERRR